MSASSDLSRAVVIDRVAARLAFLSPSGRSQVFFGRAHNLNGLDAFAVISDSTPIDVEGFGLVISKSHRSYKTLGSVIEKIWLGMPLPKAIHVMGIRFCERSGISAIVGSRICGMAVPGMREYYFQKQGLGSAVRDWRGRILDLFGETIMAVWGAGKIPVIGATAASALVCVFSGILQSFVAAGPWYSAMVSMCLLSTVLCCLLEGWARKHYFADDPREVVLDEVAGMSLALLITGPGMGTLVAVFFAFRFFDIFKFGIHWIEKQKILGTIVWDDLLAGIYAGLAVKWAFMIPAAFFYE
jgi:phosphatidylglycerophosphatase A